jgi:hypothetical protein
VALADEVVLPDEEDDLTTSEPHVRVFVRLFSAVSFALRGRALVLMDIFLRVVGREQAAPDLLVALPAPSGARKVYRVRDEPVPLAPLKVMSTANYESAGAPSSRPNGTSSGG